MANDPDSALPKGAVLVPGTDSATCPGWTSDQNASKHPCAEGRKTQQLITRRSWGVWPAMCARCRKAKDKYDEEHGAAAKRRAEAQGNYETLIAAYEADVAAAVGATPPLYDLIGAIDGLVIRAKRPPHAQYGTTGYETRYGDRIPYDGDKLNVLRKIAGRELVIRPERGW